MRVQCRCGDPKLVMSEERNFTTAPAPGAQAYPQRLTVVADLGQTYNSSRTLEHIIASQPRVRPKTLAPRDHHCRAAVAVQLWPVRALSGGYLPANGAEVSATVAPH